MRKFFLLGFVLLLSLSLARVSLVKADDGGGESSCITECVNAGNAGGECSQFCANDPNIDWDATYDPLEGPTALTFDTLNPLRVLGSPFADQLSSPGGIVSRVLVFAFPLAGLILFVMLVWGGFEIMLGAASQKMVDAGKQRITAAIVGFLLLFSSYWITQIIEVIFGVVIL